MIFFVVVQKASSSGSQAADLRDISGRENMRQSEAPSLSVSCEFFPPKSSLCGIVLGKL